MANLVVQHQPGDEFYQVLDVDANLIVGSFVDPQVANSFAAAGNTSKEALFAAVRSDVNATGGTQSSANSPPGTSPAPPYVQPSYIKTGSDSTYQQPTYVTPPSGNNVTYASTDDPESRAIFAQLKAQAAAARPQYTTQTVANPLYEGGTQTILVPVDQTKTSANPSSTSADPSAEALASLDKRRAEAAARINSNTSADPLEDLGILFGGRAQATSPVKSTLPAADAALNKAADIKAAQDWLTAGPNERARIEKSTGLSASEIQGIASGNNLTGITPISSAANLPPDPFAAENASPFVPASQIDTSAANVPNYVSQYNDALGTWEVVDSNTGAVAASGLTEQQSQLQAQEQDFIDAPTPVPTSQIDTSAANVANYVALYNEATATWQVLDGNTGAIIADNLPDEATANEVLGLQQAAVSSTPVPQPQATGQSPYVDPIGGLPYDDSDPPNLRPGWTLIDGKPVYLGGSFVAPATLASAQASRTSAAAERARKQQAYIDQQRNLNNSDWRVRLSLAKNSNYLYNVEEPGILDPLKPTNGVIFPYTPQITTNYKANYNSYDLTHSNYRGYYYQNSFTDTITITGTFTAQTLVEANYLLAVIHFFRSVTKMFYGQSQNVGSPPPVCYLNGLGEFQFNKHPVLVTNFAYTLPRDVDYIRALSANNLQLNQNPLRAKTNTVNPQLASVQRLANAFIKPINTPPPPTQPNTNNPTYVPTKMEITVNLLPIQSRAQVSQQFNLQTFANGQQLRGGFW